MKYDGALPLRTLQAEEPFQMWGINFIGETSDKSSGGHSWILVATNTKWVEAIPTRQSTSKVVIKFLIENILTRFGVPQKIVADNGMCFRSNEFVEIIKPIAKMLKKGAKIAWDNEAVGAFAKIKKAIQKAPVLKSPYFKKPFQLFSFASYHTIATVMLQKNDEGHEQPIAFFSKSLQAAELNYDINEKQAYALVKVVKSFRPYLLGAEVIAYVSNATIKDIFR